MSFINAGIKEVYFTKGDSNGMNTGKYHKGNGSATGPSNTIFGLGIRQEGQLIGEPFNEIKDKDNRSFNNLFNFRGEFSTMQVDIEMLEALVNYSGDDSVATAFLTRGIQESGGVIIPSGTGGIFLFDTNGTDNGLGMDFELNISQTDRIMNMIFERAFSVDNARALITAADTSANQVPFEANKTPQIITADVMTGFISPSDMITEMPTDLEAAFQSSSNLAEFSVNLKTKSAKNSFNKSIISGFEVDLMAKASGPDVPALYDAANIVFPGDVTYTIRSGETIVFKTIGLTQRASFNLGDSERSVTVNMMGTYDLDYVVVVSDTSVTFHTFLQES